MEVRKFIDLVEEIRMESVKPVAPPARKAAAVALIKNPYADIFADDLDPQTELVRSHFDAITVRDTMLPRITKLLLP